MPCTEDVPIVMTILGNTLGYCATALVLALTLFALLRILSWRFK